MEGLRALRAGLPRGDSRRPTARADLYGSYLAAVAFASAGSGLHHKICHVLGGAFGLPHAATHAIVLPYVLAFNAPAAPDAAARIAAALGSVDAPTVCAACARSWTRRRALRDSACARTTSPRRSTPSCRRCRQQPAARRRRRLTALLRAAWAGRSDPGGARA